MIVDTNAKQLLFCTALIRTVIPGGKSTGTGFVYNVTTSDPDKLVPVLVTNKHVIEGAITGQIGFIKNINGRPSAADYVELNFGQGFAAMWFHHPDPDVDVAVMPLGPAHNQLISSGFRPYYIGLAEELFPTAEVVGDLDAIEEVTFIGYPNGLVDSVNHTPIFRRGITATPIEQDWNGKPQFLIDASVFPGSSGSPVFILDRGSYHHKGNLVVGNRIHFLGILAAVHQQSALAEIILASQNPKAVVRQNMDLGIVYKWHTIERCIDDLCAKRGISREKISNVGPMPNSA